MPTTDVLPNELHDGDCLCLDPFGEIVDCNYQELAVSWSQRERSHNVNTPLRERTRGRDDCEVNSGLMYARAIPLTSVTLFHKWEASFFIVGQ